MTQVREPAGKAVLDAVPNCFRERAQAAVVRLLAVVVVLTDLIDRRCLLVFQA